MSGDIRISVDFYSHPKTKLLEKRLGHSASRSLIILWSWTAKNRPYGDLSGLSDEIIEAAADWPGESGTLVRALCEVGFIDGEIGERKLHDWLIHNPWAAGQEERSNKSRLNLMAKTFPELYQLLVNAGYKGITKEEYERITNPQRFFNEFNEFNGFDRLDGPDPLSTPEAPLDDSLSTPEAPLNDCLSPSPKPSPSPAPVPVPVPAPREMAGKTTSSLVSEADAANPDPEKPKEPEPQEPPEPVPESAEDQEKSPGRQKRPKKPLDLPNLLEMPEKFTVSRLKDLWNQELLPLGFPAVVKISPSRERSFRARLKDDPARASPEWWAGVIAAVAGSEFMRQSALEKRAWLTIDWLLNEHNLVKVLEGKYSGGVAIRQGQNGRKRPEHLRDPDEILRDFYGSMAVPLGDTIEAEARASDGGAGKSEAGSS